MSVHYGDVDVGGGGWFFAFSCFIVFSLWSRLSQPVAILEIMSIWRLFIFFSSHSHWSLKWFLSDNTSIYTYTASNSVFPLMPIQMFVIHKNVKRQQLKSNASGVEWWPLKDFPLGPNKWPIQHFFILQRGFNNHIDYVPARLVDFTSWHSCEQSAKCE